MDPHINPATGNWDDNYYANIGQYGGSTGNSQTDQIFQQNAAKENQYIDSLMSQNKGQLDLALKQLDAQHKLALGNDDTEQAKFLESVANSLESQIGRIPYDYQKYSNRELQQYAMGNTNIANNKQLALDKLSNDEQNNLASLNLNQGQANQATAEDLNKRGLLTGQAPQGMFQGSSLTGINGVGGQVAGQQNTDFGNQRNVITSGYDLGVRGTNLDASQQQNALDFQHQNTMTDLTDQARRDAQDAGNAYTFGTQSANLGFQAQQAALERQRQQLLAQDRQNAINQSGRQQGILGY